MKCKDVELGVRFFFNFDGNCCNRYEYKVVKFNGRRMLLSCGYHPNEVFNLSGDLEEEEVSIIYD